MQILKPTTINNFRTTNADSSAGFESLSSYECAYIIIVNDSNVDIDVRLVGNTDFFRLEAGTRTPLPIVENANEWEFARTDRVASTASIGVIGYR